MDQAIQSAVKDFEHTSDYYFMLFNNFTNDFETTNSTTGQTPTTPTSDDAEETTTDSSDKEYLDYLLFGSGDDAVIVRIERRSPSPSTLKNCNEVINNSHKISLSSSTCWNDGLIADFDNKTVNEKSTNTAQTSAIAGSTARKLRKSPSLFTDINSFNNSSCSNNHLGYIDNDQPMKQLQNNAAFCNSEWMITRENQKTYDNVHYRLHHKNLETKDDKNGGNISSDSISQHNVGDSSDDDLILFDQNSEKPWICKNCHRGYKWRNSLTCHQKNECGKPPKYYCTKFCGYRTNIRSNLRRHLNTKCSSKDKSATLAASSTSLSSPSSSAMIKSLKNYQNLKSCNQFPNISCKSIRQAKNQTESVKDGGDNGNGGGGNQDDKLNKTKP